MHPPRHGRRKESLGCGNKEHVRTARTPLERIRPSDQNGRNAETQLRTALHCTCNQENQALPMGSFSDRFLLCLPPDGLKSLLRTRRSFFPCTCYLAPARH